MIAVDLRHIHKPLLRGLAVIHGLSSMRRAPTTVVADARWDQNLYPAVTP